MVWGRRWEGGSGLGTRVHLWQMHVDVWQNQYNILSKKNFFKKEEENKPKIIKKIVLRSCVLIITLNVNGLNAPTKRHRLARQMKTCACMYFHLPHHST